MTCLSLRVGMFPCGRLRPHLLPIIRVGGIASLLACGVISAALAANKVTVKLEGEIGPECAIQGGTVSGSSSTLGMPLALGDISQPGHREFGFMLNCNTPFSYRLEAQYGALTNTSASVAPNGFTDAVPYDVAVRIPTDGAAIEDRCASGSIRSGRITCPFTDSGNKIALQSAAQLTITWQPPGKMPLAGAYVERLTVEISMVY
jgi:hypothetical protein